MAGVFIQGINGIIGEQGSGKGFAMNKIGLLYANQIEYDLCFNYEIDETAMYNYCLEMGYTWLLSRLLHNKIRVKNSKDLVTFMDKPKTIYILKAGEALLLIKAWEQYIDGFPKDPNKFPCSCYPYLSFRFWNHYDHPDYNGSNYEDIGHGDDASFRRGFGSGADCGWKVAINRFGSTKLSEEFSKAWAAIGKSYFYVLADFKYNVPGGSFEVQKCLRDAPSGSPGGDSGLSDCPKVNILSLPVVRVRVTCRPK